MAVVEWLLDSDPSIRWQVMRDLTDEPAEVVAAERSRVAVEGWGARLLALQGADGQWGTDVVDHIEVPADGPLPSAEDRKLLRELVGLSQERMADWLGVAPTDIAGWETAQLEPDGGLRERYRSALARMRATVGTFFPAWTSTFFTLVLLWDLGLVPSSEPARRAVALVRDNSRWDEGGQPFFSGEVEPCINGRVVGLGAYFGQDVEGVVDRLLGEQLRDGGWNCEAERGSTRSSFHTTICVLEGLLEYEQTTGGSPEVSAARLRGQEYLLERRMFRRLSDGEVVDPAWTLFSFPTRWHYDVLRGLDHLRRAGVAPDRRCSEAIDLVAKRDDDGRWPLENPHPGRVHFDMGEAERSPSRWNTLRAMRVLNWYEQGQTR
jgi:hypothetical protein